MYCVSQFSTRPLKILGTKAPASLGQLQSLASPFAVLLHVFLFLRQLSPGNPSQSLCPQPLVWSQWHPQALTTIFLYFFKMTLELSSKYRTEMAFSLVGAQHGLGT